MDGNDKSNDRVIAELADMGFDIDKALEAVEAVGPRLDLAVDHILNGPHIGGKNRTREVLGSASGCSSSRSYRRTKQLSIRDHLVSSRSTKGVGDPDVGICEPERLSRSVSQEIPEIVSSECEESELAWEQRVVDILKRHFGIPSLKPFQKEALEAWMAHKDCLVLAATGSGKSLCFQIPALLTGKIVVVVSPLISLMHDQCMKLAKHGVSACFLGSGQTDSSVERKAMNGVYRIIYVCPETIVRLIGPLKRLAENHGIALFAIDEAHCVSKWGHDFRPDYRRLSVLRENFRACNLKFLKFDIPLMSLTATATVPVREDIIKSLCMSRDTRIILTSFFRPNLRFSVKHSRTTCVSSYEKDFQELVEFYMKKTMFNRKTHKADDIDDALNSCRSLDDIGSDADEASSSDSDHYDENHEFDDEEYSSIDGSAVLSRENQLTVEYLEDELDVHQSVDDLDVSCGEFIGDCPSGRLEVGGACSVSSLNGSLEQGSTIVYVPTRKETTKLAAYLCKSGVRAAAYHAKLPKTHLRRVHEMFHHNSVEVVVATIAFGMGIDKSNVRRIIHYGWPQSLEAYYQEAGRAGRDGKLSDCTLYANLLRIPTLLPSQRSKEQTKQAYKMLSDCFRYGMSTATCRAKILVKYFGEEFSNSKCHMCDICVNGPPKMQNLKEEATSFMQILNAQNIIQGHMGLGGFSEDGGIYTGSSCTSPVQKLNFKMILSRIREQKFSASDRQWWQGLARILEDGGFIREGDEMARVAIRYPELTELGLQFLNPASDVTLYAYPEADMLLSLQEHKPYSTFSDWGRGWADPELRRQRLQRTRSSKKRKRKRPQSKQRRKDLTTVRGRLAAKLAK